MCDSVSRIQITDQYLRDLMKWKFGERFVDLGDSWSIRLLDEDQGLFSALAVTCAPAGDSSTVVCFHFAMNAASEHGHALLAQPWFMGRPSYGEEKMLFESSYTLLVADHVDPLQMTSTAEMMMNEVLSNMQRTLALA